MVANKEIRRSGLQMFKSIAREMGGASSHHFPVKAVHYAVLKIVRGINLGQHVCHVLSCKLGKHELCQLW